MSVETIIEDDRWAEAGLEALAARAVEAALAHLGLEPDAWDVAVMGCDDARIAALNGDFRGKALPTNVLSWPSQERGASAPGEVPEAPGGDTELGDLAIAFETVEAEARAAGIPLDHHVSHLIVHGLLHLLGYDHEYEADGDLMEATEIAILGKLGIPDPYVTGAGLDPVVRGKD